MEHSVDPDRRGRLVVAGCPIAWAAWHPGPARRADGSEPGSAADRDSGTGETPDPAVVLIHGASAHLGWWDAVVPHLQAAGRQVIALELSGHGESGHRAHYAGQTWATELLAVVEQVAGGPVLLVGHSLGGRVAILAAARAPALVPRLVLVDVALRPPDGPPRRRIPPRLGPRAVYPSLDAAVDAFHLRPREEVADHALLRRVAAGAYRPENGGWTLRADLEVFHRVGDGELADALARVAQPLTMIYGNDSPVVDADGLAFLRATHSGETELVALDGRHQLTFDQAARVAAIVDERWRRLAAAA